MKALKQAINRHYRLFISILFMLIDLLSLFISIGSIYLIWSQVKGDMLPSRYWGLAPLLLIFLLAYSMIGLYPGIGIGPVEELRRLTIATSIVFLILGSLSFFFRNAYQYSRVTFILSWLVALMLVPIGRHLLRKLLISLGFWGEPIAIVGFGGQGKHVYQFLLANRGYGLMPKCIVNVDGRQLEPVDGIDTIQLDDPLSNELQAKLQEIQTGILVTSDLTPKSIDALISGHYLPFRHTILVSEKWVIGTAPVAPYDLGGMFGLEVRQNLLNKNLRGIKRLIEFGLILLLGPIWLTMLAIFGLLIYIESPGNIFFTQVRLGQYGKKIHIWKLRTMVPDAESALQNHLELYPAQRYEWLKKQKLQRDPRVTRIGRFLRRYSMDELPQFINVLIGDMSLVGPRPIVDEEIPRYGRKIDLIRQVKPGLTGLWQVSGRNDLEYEDRVALDEYYVRNWSIWMDIYIISKTFTVLFSGKGAY